MSLNIVYRGPKGRSEAWSKIALAEIPDLKWHVWPDVPEDVTVDALVTWLAPKGYEELFPNLKVIFSVGAGVNQFHPRKMPPQIKLVKMIDPSINTLITSYVTSSVFMLHRDHFHYLEAKKEAKWSPLPIKFPADCHVGILGLGSLGQSVASQLKQLNFKVSGWNRSERNIDGVTTYVGEEQFDQFLSDLDIVICLLPLTEETTGILNAETFAKMPKGASVINVGRGQHIVEEDLIAALDSEQLSYAVLDVFDREPLPEEHPFWQHTKIHITPHIAAYTSDETAGLQLVDNLKRLVNNQPLIGEIDKVKGY